MSSKTHPFFWAVGIEDTNIGWPLRGSGMPLDEYASTGHYEQWRADFDLVVESGATTVRYGLPWYRINPAPGVWDWEWADEVIRYAAGELGLLLILDLVHYGTPAWLEGSFTDPGYPAAVAEYSGAVAARYAGLVDHFTPLNEPLVTASFTGARAIWPPYETGDAGWARVVVNIAAGIRESIRAILHAQPDATIVHVEATHVWTTEDPALEQHRDTMSLRNFLPTDLVLGRVDARHPLHAWLLETGIAAEALDALLTPCPAPAIIGVNFYPELSCREFVLVDGAPVGVAFNGWTDGLRQVLGEFDERYGIPLMISETAVEGDPEHLVSWLRDCAEEVSRLRADGAHIVGLTWWPLFDFVDWSWGSGGRIVEEFYTRVNGVVSPVIPPPPSGGIASYFRRMGMWRLREGESSIDRERTAVVDAYRSLAGQPYASIEEQKVT
jgi:beta-glucosidase